MNIKIKTQVAKNKTQNRTKKNIGQKGKNLKTTFCTNNSNSKGKRTKISPIYVG